MEIYTPFKRPTEKPLILDVDDRTERTGYRSAETQIRDLLNAGERLANYRNATYYGADTEAHNARHYGEIDRTIADEKLRKADQVLEDLEKKTEAKREASKTPPKPEVSIGTESSSKGSVPPAEPGK